MTPITFKQACAFIERHHRHNKAPQGCKFALAVRDEHGAIVGVATAGRPIARHFDDHLTLEVNRTCTTGARNANSALYGAVWRAARAMGYRRCITYTQEQETGASLRAAGWTRVRDLAPRENWDQASRKRRNWNDPDAPSGIARVLWEIRR